MPRKIILRKESAEPEKVQKKGECLKKGKRKDDGEEKKSSNIERWEENNLAECTKKIGSL